MRAALEHRVDGLRGDFIELLDGDGERAFELAREELDFGIFRCRRGPLHRFVVGDEARSLSRCAANLVRDDRVEPRKTGSARNELARACEDTKERRLRDVRCVSVAEAQPREAKGPRTKRIEEHVEGAAIARGEPRHCAIDLGFADGHHADDAARCSVLGFVMCAAGCARMAARSARVTAVARHALVRGDAADSAEGYDGSHDRKELRITSLERGEELHVLLVAGSGETVTARRKKAIVGASARGAAFLGCAMLVACSTLLGFETLKEGAEGGAEAGAEAGVDDGAPKPSDDGGVAPLSDAALHRLH